VKRQGHPINEKKRGFEGNMMIPRVDIKKDVICERGKRNPSEQKKETNLSSNKRKYTWSKSKNHLKNWPTTL